MAITAVNTINLNEIMDFSDFYIVGSIWEDVGKYVIKINSSYIIV